jgi:hypothetical protein
MDRGHAARRDFIVHRVPPDEERTRAVGGFLDTHSQKSP